MKMIEKENIGETEKRILEAARIVFLEKGLDRAKMQDIADTANISRTALNYYFRKKENLYKGIFEQIFYTIVPSVDSIISKRIPVLDKLNSIIDIYDNMFRENRTFPKFIFTELQRNPKMMIQYFKGNKDAQKYLGRIISLLENEMAKGNIRKIAIGQIITTFFSLLVAPYLLNPIICEYLGSYDQVTDQLLDEHKNIAKEVMENLLKLSN